MTDIALDPWEPTAVSNLNVPGIVERLDRMVYEMLEGESAHLNDLLPDDIKRLIQNSAAIQTYVKVIFEGTALDLPHSYEAMYPIHYATKGYDYDAVKNKSLRDLTRLLVNAWVQWSRSESADRSNALYEDDYIRFVRIMEAYDNMIAAYVTEATPLDTPASSQYEIISNAG
jgi:hypothetical protein